MKLVFIHGRDQQGKDPIALHAEWKHTLVEGLAKVDLELPDDVEILFPFYGDKLADLINQLDAPLVADVIERGAAADDKEAAFRSEILYEMATQSGISDAEIQAYYGGVHDLGPLNWEWIQAILRALDRTPLGDRSIDRFTRDVYVYLTYKPVRKAIDEIVQSAFTIDGSYVVVGHSLGSVVGYNVLNKLATTKLIRAYITVGSPLGIKAIRKQLDTPLTMPDCVSEWYNAMDDRDVVALYPLDAQNFPITPPIINKTNVDNHTDNRHGIVGYLDDPEVAKRIYQALRDD